MARPTENKPQREARGVNDQMTQSSLTIGIPQQGVLLQFKDPQSAVDWFDKQLAFWNELKAEIGGSFQIGREQFETTAFFNNVIATVRAARASVVTREKPLSEFVDYAQRLQLIVAGGSIAEAMQDARLARRREDIAGYLITFGYPFWPPDIRGRGLWPLASALVTGHPANRLLAYSEQIVSMQKNMSAFFEQQSAATTEMQEAKKEFEQKIAAWSGELEELKKLYETHISLKAPATYWDVRRRASVKVAWIAALAFLLVIGGAVVLAYVTAGPLLDFVHTHSGGLTVVNGILVIIAPLLALGWILRHISRILVLSINNANDAAFRKALVETFLSVAQQLKAGMAEQDRALILNALFRPAPGEPQDEGPPAGLLDLLIKRQG